jgi:outer membrane protein assembly factor BamB
MSSRVRRSFYGAVVIAGLGAIGEAQGPPGLSTLLGADPSTSLGAGWTQWRGPARDGVIASFTPPAAWPDTLVKRWSVDVGIGYATPIVVSDRVYQFSRIGENETMTAFDAATGTQLWQGAYPAEFTMNSVAAAHGKGPKSTPTFFDGRLYSIGMTGTVTAWDAASGKPLWRKPGDPKNVPATTTHACSPLVEGGSVIFHLGGDNNGALTAFDLVSGAEKWQWTGDGPGYGSPVIAEVAGVRQLITITQGKVVGIEASTGALLWERPLAGPAKINSMTPVVSEATVMVSGNGSPLIAFTIGRTGTQWSTETIWENADLRVSWSDVVIAGDALIGLSSRNSGQYVGVDLTSGTTLWTSAPRLGPKSARQRAGSLIFILEADGELVVARESKTAFDVVKRYKVADQETWSQPAISGNRTFVKDVSTLTLWTLD